jgi:hypothetical protein
MNWISQRRLITLMLFILTFGVCLTAQENTSDKGKKETLFDLIYSMDIKSASLTVDLDSVLLNKMTDKEHEGMFTVQSQTGDVLELPLKVSVRSKSRRRICSFPPLKFDFDKQALENLGLRKQDDYKIVTHCLEDEQGEQVLVKEYMVYQLLQILTPISLRAKLFEIEYNDKDSDQSLMKKAVILESEDEFVKRLDGEICDCMGAARDSIEPVTFETIAMFQYMVGNLDMNYGVERNVKFIRQKPGETWLSFAYDFDHSSVVNAPYVYPDVKNNMTIRPVYLGFVENASYLDEVKVIFREKKSAIIEYIQEFDLISKNDRRDILQYIRSFYDKIEDPQWVVPYRR